MLKLSWHKATNIEGLMRIALTTLSNYYLDKLVNNHYHQHSIDTFSAIAFCKSFIWHPLRAELMDVCFCWSAKTCEYLWRNPKENANVFLLTSPIVLIVCCPSYWYWFKNSKKKKHVSSSFSIHVASFVEYIYIYIYIYIYTWRYVNT